jgi:class 3 adenylate cyclase/tetratricopeptide (TPR) repeat protein
VQVSGARFQVSVSDTRSPVPAPGSYTPKHLADKILTSRAALEGERKQVTVLFADVKGSMELAEQVDPEEWHKILDRFFQILTDGVHRFEGTVNQYTGDGIMALFGAPIAHEDHAQRACWAALWLREPLRAYADELRRTRGLSFAVRMGLNSGAVVVGKIGDDLRMDYTAQGHAVGLAQRMEQLAEPGAIYLTEHTARLVEGWFRLRDLGAFTLKGVAEPVGVSALEGAGTLRTRLDVSQARGFSRFVGRAHEMEQLEAALASAIEGRGQFVGVVGEAGVGKSRLCREFVERCRARDIPIMEAHCLPYGRSLPLLPVIELVRAFYGITERDDPTEARRRIAGMLVLLDESFQTDLPLAFDFAGFPDPDRPPPDVDPEARRRRVLDFVRRLFAARSAREAAVLLVDDLHWIDAQSDEFIAQIVDSVAATRTLLLLNFRPEYDAAWMARSDHHRIPLLPLGAEAADELLRDLLGGDPSLDALRTHLCERAGGNPFFAEELVSALAESGALAGERGAYRLVRDPAAASLPATVQGILAARIDRLAEREKRVLQSAAVIGRELDEPVLERVAGCSGAELAGALDVLRRAEFLHPTALYPVARFAFKHPLTQQVAYESQLSERRARLHAAAARAIEEIDGARLDERAALLAHHWESAGESLAAARWHRRAATAGREPQASLLHWRRVRDLAAAGDERSEALGLRAEACREILFTIWRTGAEEAEWRAVYEEGEALARRSGDRRTLATLLSGLAGLRGFRGEHRAQIELLEQAFALAREAGDFALEASLYYRIGWAWDLAGDGHRGLEWSDRGVAFCETDPARAGRVSGFDTFAWLLGQRGTYRIQKGQLAEAELDLERALARARGVDDAFAASFIWAGFCILAWVRGDREAMLRAATESLERALVRGDRLIEPIARFFLGHALQEAGRSGESVAEYERAVASYREQRVGILMQVATTYAGLAVAAAGAGDETRAREALAEMDAILRAAPEVARSATRLWLDRAGAVLTLDGARGRAEVEAALARVLDSARDRGWDALAPLALQLRARLARLLGDMAAAERDLREAQHLFEAMGAPLRAAECERELTV